ncbi:MAG TPA: S41 family peptidase [Candidatus Acidoferrales bacterium]|nr:S41 family peptidase [Candidatus Acidoferrales bacterium]
MTRGKRTLLVLAIVVAICAGLGGFYGPAVRATAQGNNNIEESVKSFTHVLAVVERNYAKPVNVDSAIYHGAIPGMLAVLDPHSSFFDKRAFALLEEDQHGQYYGVGMEIGPESGRTVVISPFPGSPAYQAGIRPGDVLLEVDKKSCKGLTTDQVASMLKGPRGTVVHITVGREGWDKPFEFTITRDAISHPAVDFYTIVKPGVGYIKISTFESEDEAAELAEALQKLDAPHLDGLILDLRGNPGGLFNQAVETGDMLLDRGQLIVSHRGRASPERRYYAVHGNQGDRVPIVVMIDGNTASASEIIAGALQDHDRALIAGQTSFGKGLVQTVSPLGDGTGLALTTARYYTPSGRLIQRPYHNISYWEYRFNPQPAPKADVKLTDSGRSVYGEGGITPDVQLPVPKLDAFQNMLLQRGVFFPLEIVETGVGDFTRYYVGTRPTVTRDFVVNDAVIDQFKRYLDKEHITYTDQDIQQNLDWLKWKIKREVFTSIFGINAGYRVQLDSDPEMQKAVELIPQARALYENARKILAERTAAQSLNR